MDYICCYIDVQGFYANNVFYPRECAVLSDHGASVFSVDHELKMDQLSANDQRQALYLTRKHHGLPFEVDKGAKIQSINDIIIAFYECDLDDDHFLAACKSKEAEDMLRALGIPRFNLGKLGATWSGINTRLEPCSLHVNPGKCSLNAVIGMKKWVEKG
uniref:Uncharacterized protein n=1 Tax=Tetranychus urticae TaxID=32264 RepID=A0A158P4X9_TETUR